MLRTCEVKKKTTKHKKSPDSKITLAVRGIFLPFIYSIWRYTTE